MASSGKEWGGDANIKGKRSYVTERTHGRG